MTTLATLTCAADLKVEIDEDVSVVGFDDYPWMSARRTPITAIRQPIEEIAQSVWAALKRGMGNDAERIPTPALKCNLKTRVSTRAVAPEAGLASGTGQKVPIPK